MAKVADVAAYNFDQSLSSTLIHTAIFAVVSSRDLNVVCVALLYM